ncbi:hypothetical protein GBAR_LOCUS31811, partial [Geodia barretti]
HTCAHGDAAGDSSPNTEDAPEGRAAGCTREELPSRDVEAACHTLQPMDELPSGDVEAGCLTCQPIDPDPTIFVVLYDEPTHRALALPGAPVAQHAVHPHLSAIELKLFLMECACREAKLTYSAHAVMKDCGPPPLYHPGILRGLSERQYAEIVKALLQMLTRRLPGQRTPVSNWSLAVQGAGLNPIGHIYVFRSTNVEELQELHIRGAFARRATPIHVGVGKKYNYQTHTTMLGYTVYQGKETRERMAKGTTFTPVLSKPQGLWLQ